MPRTDDSAAPGELDLESAKQTLTALPGRAGYGEAMERAVPDTTYRLIVVIAIGCLAALLFGVWTYFAHSWLRWPASVGLVGLMAVFANAFRARATLTVGATPPVAAVVLACRPALDPDTGAIAPDAGGTLSLLLLTGATSVTASAPLYSMVRAGDAGVATLSHSTPPDLHSFRRLT